jgi:hypothetical protein
MFSLACIPALRPVENDRADADQAKFGWLKRIGRIFLL